MKFLVFVLCSLLVTVATAVENEENPGCYGDGKPCGFYCKRLGQNTAICDLASGDCVCEPIVQPKAAGLNGDDPSMYPCIGDGKPCGFYCQRQGLIMDICDFETGECTCKEREQPKPVAASLDRDPECAGDGKRCDFYCAKDGLLGRCDFETGACSCYKPDWMEPMKPKAAGLNGDDPSMYPCVGDGKPCGFYCRRQGLVMDICDFQTGECTCKERETIAKNYAAGAPKCENGLIGTFNCGVYCGAQGYQYAECDPKTRDCICRGKPKKFAAALSPVSDPECFGDGKQCEFYCSDRNMFANCDFNTGACTCYSSEMFNTPLKKNAGALKCENGPLAEFNCGFYCGLQALQFVECHPTTRECICGKSKPVAATLNEVSDPQCFGDGKQCEFYCGDRSMFANCDFETGTCTCYSPDEPTPKLEQNPGCLGDGKACTAFCTAQDLMTHCDFKTGECVCRVPVA